MSATDELRRLLDERGVEYRFNDITKVFEWHFEGTDGDGSAHATEVNGGINIIACSLTPEQAIAATLGDVPRLPHFWTHDGALHVELPKLPESISVRLPDQRDREVGSARVWQYTLGNDGVGRTNDGLADLQAENAKLRELVSDFDKCLTEAARLAYIQGHMTIYDGTLLDSLHPRMRELGVEVDDG